VFAVVSTLLKYKLACYVIIGWWIDLSDRHGRSTLKRELDLFSHQASFLITSTPPVDTLLPTLRVYDLAKIQKREESKKIKMHRTYSMRQSRAPTVSPSLPFPHAPDAYLRIAGERQDRN
jgi:hypothetical protein